MLVAPPAGGVEFPSAGHVLTARVFFQVALGMRGLGRHTKRGSGFIVGGVAGGAVVPPILGAVADASDTPMAMVIPLVFFVLALSYAVAVNFVPAYRNVADAFSTTEVGVVRQEGSATIDMEKAVAVGDKKRHHETTI